MINIIRTENLKMKRTNVRKVIVILPILIVVLLLLIARRHIDYNGYNWWYSIMLPVTAGVIGVSLSAKDRVKFRYKGLIKYDMNQNKIWISKVIVGIGYLILANTAMLILIEITERLVGLQAEDISIFTGMISMIISVICSMWLIPFSMIIYNLIGSAMTFLIIFGGAIFGLVKAMSVYWWVFPFSWVSRVQTPIVKLFPNGIIVNEGHPILNMNVVPIGILLALLGLIICTGCLLMVMKRSMRNV